jgi:hypothetical protein
MSRDSRVASVALVTAYHNGVLIMSDRNNNFKVRL